MPRSTKALALAFWLCPGVLGSDITAPALPWVDYTPVPGMSTQKGS